MIKLGRDSAKLKIGNLIRMKMIVHLNGRSNRVFIFLCNTIEIKLHFRDYFKKDFVALLINSNRVIGAVHE